MNFELLFDSVVDCLLLWGFELGPCFVSLSVLSTFAIILLRKIPNCFTLLVFLLSCGCLCSVSLPQYHGLVCNLSKVVAIPGHAQLFVFSSSSIGCVCRKLGLQYAVKPV